MRRLIFLSAIFLSPALCSAQISILDYGSPAAIKTTTVLNLSEPITVSTGASVAHYGEADVERAAERLQQRRQCDVQGVTTGGKPHPTAGVWRFGSNEP